MKWECVPQAKRISLLPHNFLDGLSLLRQASLAKPPEPGDPARVLGWGFLFHDGHDVGPSYRALRRVSQELVSIIMLMFTSKLC